MQKRKAKMTIFTFTEGWSAGTPRFPQTWDHYSRGGEGDTRFRGGKTAKERRNGTHANRITNRQNRALRQNGVVK